MEKVTGRAIYTADITLPRMAHVKFLRSAKPHAKVKAIDTHAAEGIPGILAIVNPLELVGKQLKDMLGRHLPILTDEPRYVGEEILAICAETEESARLAVSRITIDYEDLPFSIDPEEQVKARQFVGGGWTRTALGQAAVYQRGDPDRAMAGADRVIERTYRSAPAIHASLEPHGAVAQFEDGKWTVWESTQGVFAVRDELAELLGEPAGSIRVICRHIGGGFGGKASAGKHTFLAAYLSKKLGRPVRCVLDRSEEFALPYGRPAAVMTIKVGVRRDGKIMAIEQKGIHAIGPYEFGAEWGSAEDMLAELYACDNVRTETRAALTHVPPPCAMRAPGYAQAAFALEQAIDEAALAIGMDAIQFRLKNIPARDPSSGKDYASPKGMHGLAECLKKGAAIFQWDKKKNELRQMDRSGPIRRGIGVAATVWSGEGGPPAGAIIRLNSDGSADLFVGAADIGTGTRTAFAQILAEETGIATADIRVINADTHLTPNSLPSYGSLTLASTGPAVRRAANAGRAQLATLAADLLETEETKIVFRDGLAIRPAARKTPESAVPIKRLVSLTTAREIISVAEREGNPNLAIKTFAVQFVDLEVHIRTGKIMIKELVAVNDSGRVINPLSFRSQQIGGVTMGIGMGILEERVFDRKTGKSLNPNLGEYKVPTILDQPGLFQTGAVEIPFDGNSIGAKGLGEPPIIPTSPAIANALAMAINTRLTRLPLTPQRVIESIPA